MSHATEKLLYDEGKTSLIVFAMGKLRSFCEFQSFAHHGTERRIISFIKKFYIYTEVSKTSYGFLDSIKCLIPGVYKAREFTLPQDLWSPRCKSVYHKTEAVNVLILKLRTVF